ncbi:flavodoxin family protein [Sporomusa aerivorans]|uniref:flavodoxin family protein n=1 Tax=Sporomusa aerivorans TaxID=204936 RepID=UPI00352A6955
MFRILALQGSPRANGTNSMAIDDAVRGAAVNGKVEVHKVFLHQLKIAPCQSCDSCLQTGHCCIKDDMGMIYDNIMVMDAFILAAPIYFSGMSAQAKLVIDRCQPFWAAKYVLRREVFSGKLRPGLFIATGGQPSYEGQFIGSLHVVNLFSKMIGVKNLGSITLPDLDAQPLAQRPDDLSRIFALGQKLTLV